MEAVHAYKERGQSSILGAACWLALALLIGGTLHPIATVPVIASTLAIGIYLLKKRNWLIGLLSWLIRGFIQSQYLLFAMLAYGGKATNKESFICVVIVAALNAARSLLGDWRDITHNRLDGKRTLAVAIGEKHSALLVVLLLIGVVLIGCQAFIWQALLPVLFLALAVSCFSNAYYLHQLSILICSFTYIGLFVSLTGGPVWLIDLLCAGTVLNFIFYPSLARRSNPSYVNESKVDPTQPTAK